MHVFIELWKKNDNGGGGVRMLISIETHITCDFPRGGGGGGGVRTPYPPPPLIPHMTFEAFCCDIHFQCFQCMSLFIELWKKNDKNKFYVKFLVLFSTVKPVLSRHSKKRPKMVFNTNYCLMQVKSIAECSILLTFITLPIVFKILVSSIFEWPLKTGFTVYY